MPTMKQVDEMIARLADEFDFSEKQARIFLDLPCEIKSSKREASKREASSSPDAKPRGRPPKTSTSDKSTSEKTTTPRGPTAYNLFVKAESAKVKTELEKKAPTGKLERGAVMKELGARWKDLTDKQKAKYSN